MAATLKEDEAAARRSKILLAARWCFLNFGFAKTSFEDIAKRANLSRTLLYRIFKDKEDIFTAVFAHWLVARYPEAQQAATGPGSPCHPGAAHTNLGAATTLSMKLMILAIYPIIQSAAMGAEPPLMAAAAKDAQPGSYFGPGGFLELRGHPIEAKTAPFANDVAAARMLFEELECITGIRYAL